MTGVLILGAGGHAQVVADILLHMHEAGDDLAPIGYLDDNPQIAGQRFLGLPVLGPLVALGTIEHHATIVGIGDNRTRCRIFTQLVNQGDHRARRSNRRRQCDLRRSCGQSRQHDRIERDPEHGLHSRPPQHDR